MPPKMFLAYLDLLTERGYLKRDPENVIPTQKFYKLIARAGAHFIEWWDSVEEDDPRELVSLEGARMVLRMSREKATEGGRAEEWGRLTNVLFRLMCIYIPDAKVKEMREVMMHDIGLRKKGKRYYGR